MGHPKFRPRQKYTFQPSSTTPSQGKYLPQLSEVCISKMAQQSRKRNLYFVRRRNKRKQDIVYKGCVEQTSAVIKSGFVRREIYRIYFGVVLTSIAFKVSTYYLSLPGSFSEVYARKLAN